MPRTSDLTDNAAVVFVFLCVCGLLLWIDFPAGFLLWIVARAIGPRGNRGLRPPMVVGWLDPNQHLSGV